MENLVKELPENKIAENNVKVSLAISNDSLAMIKKVPVESKDDLDYLIKRSNKRMYIVEGHSDDIYRIIDICLDAVENNKTVEIELDTDIIVFN